MSDEEKFVDDTENVDDSAEVAEESASSAQSGPRRSNRQAAANQKAVVPMWLWVVTVILLMGGAGTVWFVKTMALKGFAKTHQERMGMKNDEINSLKADKARLNEKIQDEVSARMNIKRAYDKLDKIKADKVMELQDLNKAHDALKKESSETASKLRKDLKMAQTDLQKTEAKLNSLNSQLAGLKEKEKELANAKSQLAEKENMFKETHKQLVDMRIMKDDLEKMVKYFKEEKIPQMEEYIQELEGGKEKE